MTKLDKFIPNLPWGIEVCPLIVQPCSQAQQPKMIILVNMRPFKTKTIRSFKTDLYNATNNVK